MNKQQQVEILAFTDPVCTWCWGSEPVLRKLQVWYGDQIRITPVMGGLCEDIRNFYDQANDIGGDPERSNQQIARHWLEASERHGMPVRTEGFRLFGAEIVSTYPQNIAYKAVELCNPELASKFLRRVREASAAEARQTGMSEVLIELASEVGVDVAAFISHLEDGSAMRAFRTDLETTKRHGARGFPTFLIRWGSKELMLRGYQTFRTMRAIITSLAGDQLLEHPPRKTAEAILDFLYGYGRAAPVELTTVFDLSTKELDVLLDELTAQRRICQTPAGNGCFWELRAEGNTCNPDNGICTA